MKSILTVCNYEMSLIRTCLRLPSTVSWFGRQHRTFICHIHPKTEMRIIELQPARFTGSEPLHCNLIATKLSDKPSYEALSYAWGNPVFTESVQSAGNDLAITSSLASALRRLRYNNGVRRIWVDAVSINQQDDTEKNHQLPLMAQIYENSQRVLAWLGDGDEQTHTAIQQLRELSRSSAIYGINPESWFNEFEGDDLDNHGKMALYSSVHQLDFEALYSLLKLDWFHRLWIVQEVVLAPRVTLYCGLDELEFEEFALALRIIRLFIKMCGDPFQLTTSQRGSFEYIASFRLMTQRHAVRGAGIQEPYQILQLVRENANKECKDDRDHIYGCLGLQKDKNDVGIDVNYGENTEGVYYDFALVHLQNNRIEILYDAGINRAAGADFEIATLPSWVPDWRNTRDSCFIPYQKVYFASANEAPVSIEVVECLLPSIGVRGTLIDEVTCNISTLLPDIERTKCSMHHIWNDYAFLVPKLFDLHSVFYEGSTYPTGETAGLAFARTMVLGARSSVRKGCLGTKASNDEVYYSCGEVVDWLRNRESRARLQESGGYIRSEVLPPTVFGTSYLYWATSFGIERYFMRTSSGYIGLGPFHTQPGDVIVVFDGAQTPFVLRRIECGQTHMKAIDLAKQNTPPPGDRWVLLGACYLHGFMDNEALRQEYDEKRQMFWIT